MSKLAIVKRFLKSTCKDYLGLNTNHKWKRKLYKSSKHLRLEKTLDLKNGQELIVQAVEVNQRPRWSERIIVRGKFIFIVPIFITHEADLYISLRNKTLHTNINL